MRIVADEKYIARRSRLGQIGGLASLILLVPAGIIAFSDPNSVTPMLYGVVGGALAAGLLFSFIGGYYAERFAGPLAHHLKVREALKGLDKRYVLLQYVLPVPHVLLGPDGLTVLVVKSQAGEVACRDGRWFHRQRGMFFRRLAGQEPVGNPAVEAERAVLRMERYLEEHLPGIEIPVRGVVLFVHPEIELTVEEAPLPVFRLKEIKKWLRGEGKGKTLPAEVYQRVEQVLTEQRTRQEAEGRKNDRVNSAE